MNLLFCHAKRILRQSSGHVAVLVLSISLAAFIGCDDDIATVRKIKASRQSRQQAETKVDHLGEAVGLIAKFVELDAERRFAGRRRPDDSDEPPGRHGKLVLQFTFLASSPRYSILGPRVRRSNPMS